MYCRNCGNEMADNESFCSKCGAENPGAVQTAVQRKPEPVTKRTGGKRGCRLVLMVLGAVQALMFFLFSYGRMEGSSAVLRQLASYLGINIPERLTGMSAIKLMHGCANLGIEDGEVAYMMVLVIFGLPLVMGILVLLINAFQNTKKSYILSIVLTVLTLFGYLAMKAILPAFEDMGYTIGGGVTFALLLTIVQLIVSIAGVATAKSAVK